MSDTTGIEWTDATWNPVTGCTKVSPGCDHCYAETLYNRFNGPGAFDTVTLHPDRLDKPLRWRKPKRVFVNSMSDLFHDDVPDEYIARVFAVMALAPQHTFQVLTKRHGRMRSLLSGDFERQVSEEVTDLMAAGTRLNGVPLWPEKIGPERGDNLWHPGVWPLPNVWLGVSVETQQWADIRIPALLDTPAAVRFLSCEPLLGPVNLQHSLNGDRSGWRHLSALDWVIVGGESGRGARPMHPDWARSLRDQCAAAGVPFLFKQWGEWRRYGLTDWSSRKGIYHFPDGSPVYRIGKKAAGRELDGRTWDEYPAGDS